MACGMYWIRTRRNRLGPLERCEPSLVAGGIYTGGHHSIFDNSVCSCYNETLNLGSVVFHPHCKEQLLCGDRQIPEVPHNFPVPLFLHTAPRALPASSGSSLKQSPFVIGSCFMLWSYPLSVASQRPRALERYVWRGGDADPFRSFGAGQDDQISIDIPFNTLN